MQKVKYVVHVYVLSQVLVKQCFAVHFVSKRYPRPLSLAKSGFALFLRRFCPEGTAIHFLLNISPCKFCALRQSLTNCFSNHVERPLRSNYPTFYNTCVRFINVRVFNPSNAVLYNNVCGCGRSCARKRRSIHLPFLSSYRSCFYQLLCYLFSWSLHVSLILLRVSLHLLFLRAARFALRVIYYA